MCDEPQSKKVKFDSEPVSKSTERTEEIVQLHHDPAESQQCEADAGITEYISNHPPIFGILKQRYSDFQLHEIGTDGCIVKLTSLDPPTIKDEKVDLFVLGKSQDELKNLSERISNEPVHISIQDLNKAQRKAIHCAIKSIFPNLSSTTTEKDQSKVIRVVHKSNEQVARSNWPVDCPPFTYFVLYKENKDTMEAINDLSSKLRINPSNFAYAGTKDRRAITSQLVSVKKAFPKKLLHLNKSLKQMSIGNILFRDKPLKLGDLKGNRFSIILRELKSSPVQIEPVLHSLKGNGFINYYGMQRFGTSSVPTQSIGKALLQSDWQKAIDLILKPKRGDKFYSECKKTWMETKNAENAFKKLPPFKRNSIEGRLLSGLTESSKNDLVGALNFIPRNTRLMYVHSYQSYIWNKGASHRLKKFGMKPIVGDLVYTDVAADLDDQKEKDNPEVKTLTEEDLRSGKVSIYDVILPLPGYDVVYPENGIKAFYKDLLEQDGFDIDNMRVKVKTYSLSGTYRKIAVCLADFSWSFHKYDDPTVSLIRSDIEELNKVEMPLEPPEGKHMALKLHFTLPSSSYATMALREIMKCDTSSNFQKSLNSADT